MRYILSIIIVLFTFPQCKYFSKKNTYSNLPADTAQYLMWCDALEEDSNNSELLFKRGGYLMSKKFFLRALADANRASLLDSTKSEYFLLLGDVCFAVNKTKIAVTAYERAVAIDKDNYAAYLKLGELYYIVKEHAKSLQNYEEAIRIQPSCEPCYFYKGLNFREMTSVKNHVELAIAMFQKTIALNQNYFEAYIQLGEINEGLNPKIALEYFNAAVRLRPNSVEALYHRAYHSQMQNNFDSAGADYKRILDINSNFVNAYFNVAFMQMQQSKWKSAIDGFMLVTKMDDSNAGAWYNLGLCYEQMNEIQKARNAYNDCLRNDPQYANATVRLKAIH